MVTNTNESGLESLIVSYLENNNEYEVGTNGDYNRNFAIDETRLFRFLINTQKDELEKIGVLNDDLKKHKFLTRLKDEITKQGIINILRNGINYYPVKLDLFYMTPSKNNEKSRKLFEENIFSITRQLMYSNDNTKLALDMCIFINGLPIITFELKNQLTKQNVEDAVYQYKYDRNPKELLFQFKRCIVHFALDDAHIKFCTKLDGTKSWFLPFDKGYKDGAGNPLNPNGIMTDYLWKNILTKNMLTHLIENYVNIFTETDQDTNKKTYKQIFPRYHQLDVVEKLLQDIRENGVGKKYLIQHSAGSGKSNSIAWLAHQLVNLQDNNGNLFFDTILVITDRVILDKQTKKTIKGFAQIENIVSWASSAADLKNHIENGKKIIVTTIEKFPFIKDIGTTHKNNKFAIIIDEAHSGQSGKFSAKMNLALSGMEFSEDMDDEDKINILCEGRKLLNNASYFAFTATPKNKTLEIFGTPYIDNGITKHRPFHVYTMKQAIQEGFILDVLKYYTPIESFYKLTKIIEDDPLFDKKKAHKKLKAYVESRAYTIEQKADLMVNHFHEQVIAKGKIGGKARAMVVTSSIEKCIEYYYAINKCLQNRKSPYKTIIAFSGEHEFHGQTPALTSYSLNGFSDSAIPKTFIEEPYRILIVADMFQTGYDEPLLHTMYIDKPLSDIKAVQTISRLNRAHPQKYDTFVLDFANSASTIIDAFSRYYKTTLLANETDPNKLYDLINLIQEYNIYDDTLIYNFITLYINGADRDKLDPILDNCVDIYNNLSSDDQIKFKSAAKSFTRTYNFLGAILPYSMAEWEKLSIFLTFLINKLPSPIEDDLSQGILEAIDLDSYRIEVKECMSLILNDEDAEVQPVPTGNIGSKQDAELEALSSILEIFNNTFGNIDWKDEDNVKRQLYFIPAMVTKNEKYINAMKNSDEQNARIECKNALSEVILNIMNDNMELFSKYQDDEIFRKNLSDAVFKLTYNKEGKPFEYEKV